MTKTDLSNIDPFILFHEWMETAKGSEINDPEAVCLATVDADGRPAARMVLLRGWGADGFTFNTNSESRKGRDMAATGLAALCIHWKSQQRQVRIEGRVEMLPPAESDAYFAKRPRGSQIGAHVSQQSRPLESMAALKDAVKTTEAYFEGRDVPRPDYWRGYRVIPERIEFWQQGDFRLHERTLFTKDAQGGWQAGRLYP